MKKTLFTTGWVILLVVALWLLTAPSIGKLTLIQLSRNANKHSITVPQKHSNFDFTKIKSIDNNSWTQALRHPANTNIIGKLTIPAVNIKLPIYYGLNNTELLTGVGTMQAKQHMGKGNFAIAGHHMQDKKLLLGSLHRTQLGNNIYLTDGKRVYTYRIHIKRHISQFETHYVTDTYAKPTLTIITCASGKAQETKRILVVASLTNIAKLTSLQSKYFQ